MVALAGYGVPLSVQTPKFLSRIGPVPVGPTNSLCTPGVISTLCMELAPPTIVAKGDHVYPGPSGDGVAISLYHPFTPSQIYQPWSIPCTCQATYTSDGFQLCPGLPLLSNSWSPIGIPA